MDRQLRDILVGVSACFFLSGATGLIYEVLWVRMLGLVFGHTVFAVTTVLTAFMGGLGLGSLLIGRLADSHRRPLALYGFVEIGLGLSCLVVPWVLALVESLYLSIFRVAQPSFFVLSVIQFLLVLVLLLPPTTLMGATLPILSRFYVKENASLGMRVGLLYALNTFGAVAGTALAGYVLLPHLGMRLTLDVAATLNLGIGILMLAYDWHLNRVAPMTPAPVGESGSQSPAEPARPQRMSSRSLVVVGLGLSGAASMIYEVGWARALALVIGSSTYAFTAMLLTFLLGLAVGSAAFSAVWRRRRMDPITFGVIQLGIGVTALAVLPAFEKMPAVLISAFQLSFAPEFVLVVQILLSVAAMIVPTLLMGMSFPCAVQVTAHGLGSIAVDVGRVYAVNTVGAIVGTVLAGFVLVPSLGVQSALKGAVLINLLVGVLIIVASARTLRPWQWATATTLSVAIVLGLVWIPRWNQSVMASGVAVYGPLYRQLATTFDLPRTLARSPVVFYADGPTATVSVHRRTGHTFLRVNGKTDASTGDDMHTQLMSGHIPLLLHPHPKTVLIIGLGSGVTVGAVAQHLVERIDVVEIEPAVVKASEFFARENREALKDPRVHLVIGDGRNFLQTTPRRYDVIISEPSNPWIRGLASLFSAEFFQIARSRLESGGIMLQWIQAYGIVPADLKMVVRTFRTAFPATSVWNTAHPDFLLVGQARLQPLDLDHVAAMYGRHEGLRDDMQRSGLASPYALAADFFLGEQDVVLYSQHGRINTDDLLPLEFSAPRSLYVDTTARNWAILRSFRTSELPALAGDGGRAMARPEVRHALGMAYLHKGLLTDAVTQFTKALDDNRDYLPSRLELGKAQLRLNLPLQAAQNFDAVLQRDPRNAEACFQLALLYTSQRMTESATRFAARAVALQPQNSTYQAYLGALLEGQQRYAEAVEHYLIARRERPTDVDILFALGMTYRKQGKASEAIQMLEEALSYQPDNPQLFAQIGNTYVTAGRPVEAVAALSRAIEYDPAPAQPHIDLGYAYMGQGERMKAIEAFERGLALDPGQAAAAHTLRGLYLQAYGREPARSR